MSEIKTEIKENADGSFTITDAHSTADILRWLLTQDSKEMILYLLDEIPSQRTWVGLTDDEHCDIWYKESLDWMEYGKAIEAKLKQKNGYAKEKNT
jgi:hypothetical protein